MEKEIKLDSEDMAVIEQIADKYSMSVKALGEVLSGKKKLCPRKHILFTMEELLELDVLAKQYGVKRNAYIKLCLNQAIKNNFYGLDIVKILSDKKTRNERIILEVTNKDMYKKINQVMYEYGIPFSSLVRYIALHTQLGDVTL